MKWINHLAIAGATTAVINPVLVPVALLGSTAPDWLEWILKALGQNVKHRGVTHYVLGWVVALLFALLLWDFHGLLAAFFWGGLTHVLADSMTVSGVPFSPHSDRRFHLFGGRLRTGQPGEYAIAWGIVAVCAVAMQLIHTGNDWYPFFYDWAGLYEQGIIDGKEWKDNRFRFF
jgi:inner membrane protein